MTYTQLLQHPLWRQTRNSIIDRDRFTCQHCSNANSLSELHCAVGQRIYYHSSNAIGYSCGFDAFAYTVFLNPINVKQGFGLDTFLVIYADKIEKYKFRAVAVRQPSVKEVDILIKESRWFFEDVEYGKQFDWGYNRTLHVHHQYYRMDLMPWEYPEALITLCWKCHEQLHANKKVNVHDASGNIINQLNPCLRCFGAGEFPEHNHIQNGICFRCNGARYEEFIRN